MAAVLAIAVLLASFGFIAHTVVTGKPTTLDRRIMLALRSPGDLSHGIGPTWVQEAARDVWRLVVSPSCRPGACQSAYEHIKRRLRGAGSLRPY